MERKLNDSASGNFSEVIVSIVVPTYNREKLIYRSIESIKKQVFKNWECIVVDDYSTDNTCSVLRQLTDGEGRFKVLCNQRKKGAPGARNTGILNARGEYVVLFDSDNAMHPLFLEKVYGAIKKQNVDVCSSFSNVIDEQTGEKTGFFRWIGYGNVHRAVICEKSYFDNSSTMIRKQKLLDIGLLDEDCPSFQEWDTHIRLSKIATYSTVKEELVDYYRGGTDAISRSQFRAVSGRLYILKKFKEEFTEKHFLSYLRICLGIYTRIKIIEKAGDNNCQLLLRSLRDIIGKDVWIIKILYAIKKTIKTSYKKL